MNAKWTGSVLECGGKRWEAKRHAAFGPCERWEDIQAGCDIRTQSGVAASLCHRSPKTWRFMKSLDLQNWTRIGTMNLALSQHVVPALAGGSVVFHACWAANAQAA